MPAIALLQYQVAGGQELLLHVLVLGELGTDDLFHDGQLYCFPVRAERYMAAQTLGLIGAKGGELGLFFRVDALLGLESRFGVLIGQALVGHRSVPEIAEEVVLISEAVDGRLADAAVLLDQLPHLRVTHGFRAGRAVPGAYPGRRRS